MAKSGEIYLGRDGVGSFDRIGGPVEETQDRSAKKAITELSEIG